MTIQELAQEAWDVQNACNLSGVVHGMGRASKALWEIAHEEGKGTDWVNSHPIMTLWIDKLASLNGCQSINEKVLDAYGKVQMLAKSEQIAA